MESSSNDGFIRFLEYVYPYYYITKNFIRKNYIQLLLTSIAFAYTIFLTYVFYFNPYNVLHYIQTPIIVISVLGFFLASLICYDQKVYLRFDVFISIFLFLGNFLLLFTIFTIIYFFSGYLVENTPRNQMPFFIFIIMTMLTISYKLINQIFFKDQKRNKNTKLLLDIIFYIPCLLSDSIESGQKFLNLYQNSLNILIPLFGLSLLYYYAFPYLTDEQPSTSHPLHLLGEKASLETNVIHIPQQSLKQRILNSKPYFEKEVLKLNSQIERDIKLYGQFFETNKQLFDKNKLYVNTKMIISPTEFGAVGDECINGELNCDDTNKMMCNGTPLQDHYGMNVQCKTGTTLLDTLFKSVKDSIELYETSDKNERLNMQEFCESKYDGTIDSKNISVTCEHKADISDQFIDNPSNEIYNSAPDTLYMCNDISATRGESSQDKFTMIHAYTDAAEEKRYFECRKSNIEGFNSMIHQLDINIQNSDLLNDFNEKERDLIQNMINNEESNFKQALMQFRDDPEKFKAFILSYFASNQKYMTTLDSINKYSNDTKIQLNQEISSLVKYINSMSGLHDYNYHYGISFWVYFDPQLLQISNTSQIGLIMNYSNNPKIYYDYDQSELVVKVTQYDDVSKKVEKKKVYKSKSILFQKWNNFIVNYYYGTIDIFVNNNLVFTQKGIAPYMEESDNALIFGSKEEPLINSGICNIQYNNYPYTLSEIGNMYKNNKNPCKY